MESLQISGKPGSGKSTMMKYISDNPRIAVALQEWSPKSHPDKSSRPPITASYFFWINGSAIQRSQEGLLRSILFDLLRQRPEYLDVILSTRPNHDTLSTSVFLSFKTCLETLKLILHHTEATEKVCLFIDGLDEYEGDLDNLVELLDSLRIFSNLKLCVASRPWPLFEGSYGADEATKLYMQRHNAEDIEKVVHDKLTAHPSFKKLRQAEPEADLICREIVQKAHGVFLWVYLVTRSLLEGLRNQDRVSDMKRRLYDFPSDLNKFFTYILDSLDPVYKVQVVRGFEVTMAARKRLSVAHFWHLDKEEEFGRNYAVDMAIQHLPQEKVIARADSRTETMKARIDGRFKGLLEVRFEPDGEEDQDTIQERYEKDYFSKVDFLHRTVQDFLLTTDCQKQLGLWKPADFDVNYSLAQTYLADLKELAGNPWEEPVSLTVRYLKDGILYFSTQYETNTGNSPTAIYQALNDVLHHPIDQHSTSTGNAKPITLWDGLVTRPNTAPIKNTTPSFLAWLILTDAPSFLRALVSSPSADLGFDEKKSLLGTAISFLSYDMIEILSAAQPNNVPFLTRSEVAALLHETRSEDKLDSMMDSLSRHGLCKSHRSMMTSIRSGSPSSRSSEAVSEGSKKSRLSIFESLWKGRGHSPSS
jgi:hypothetical protein